MVLQVLDALASALRRCRADPEVAAPSPILTRRKIREASALIEPQPCVAGDPFGKGKKR